jgi:hypothetical protein
MIYCYETLDGEVVDLEFPMGEQPDDVLLEDGRLVTRSFQAEGRSISTVPSNYPRESDAMGVAPSQVKEAYEASVAAGCPTQFTRDGSAVITDAKHETALARSLDLNQRNGGWNDTYTPRETG